MKRRRRRIDFAKINRAALDVLPSLLRQLLPHNEYVARNPRRNDRSHCAVLRQK